MALDLNPSFFKSKWEATPEHQTKALGSKPGADTDRAAGVAKAVMLLLAEIGLLIPPLPKPAESANYACFSKDAATELF